MNLAAIIFPYLKIDIQNEVVDCFLLLSISNHWIWIWMNLKFYKKLYHLITILLWIYHPKKNSYLNIFPSEILYNYRHSFLIPFCSTISTSLSSTNSEPGKSKPRCRRTITWFPANVTLAFGLQKKGEESVNKFNAINNTETFHSKNVCFYAGRMDTRWWRLTLLSKFTNFPPFSKYEMMISNVYGILNGI